ncbi:MAG TPA: benzoate-CoA ligase family protein [Acetobacteraceae bacterium]|nr:benzoate-CoA ligase family protein [Acetobacteraceae bacterium]
MQDNTIAIEPAATGSGLRFAPRFNAAAAFIDRHVAAGRGGAIAIRTAHETVRYADLADRVARCGNALRGLGIAPGERMLMAVLDGPAFFYLFWGAIRAGIVPVPLNTLLRAADYAWLIEDAACAAFAYSPELAAEIEPALAPARHRPAVVLRTEGDDAALPALLARAPAVLAPEPRRPEDECFWLYSSGSTGRPKGAVHAQRDLAVTSQRYAVETIGVRPTDIFFSAAKLFFAYGLGNGMAFPLWVGGTSVLMPERPTPESTFAAIARFRPTIFFGVPTLFARQIAEFPRLRPDLSSLRFCVSAGEALPSHLFETWRHLTGTEIIDGIGSTEAAHMYISHRPGSAVAGSTGRPVPGYAVKIVDEAGEELPPGVPGRLLVRGDSVASCYWRNARPITVDGWLDTGDTYRIDADGLYTYAGRSDDMMKVGGIWCSPVEIESALMEHPDVLEAAVVGREDDDGLVKPEAWIVPKHPDAPRPPGIESDLVRHCKTRLAPYKYPRWVHFVPDLPKTATGKIQRFVLRQRRVRRLDSDQVGNAVPGVKYAS